MGERLLCTQEVSGSIPLVSTIIILHTENLISKQIDFTKQKTEWIFNEIQQA